MNPKEKKREKRKIKRRFNVKGHPTEKKRKGLRERRKVERKSSKKYKKGIR